MLLKRRLFRVRDKWIRNNPNIIEKFQEDNYMMRKCDFSKRLYHTLMTWMFYWELFGFTIELLFWNFSRKFPWTKIYWAIPYEMDQISKNFPPDPHGFFWNFSKSMYPSRNEIPENFIVFLWTVEKLKPSKPYLLAWTLNHCNLWHFENAPI